LQKSQWWNVDYSVLSTLPFDDVDRFLQELQIECETANYKTISIRNNKVSVET